MPEYSELEIFGRKYLVFIATIRPKKVKAKGKEYRQYYINIPRFIADKIYEKAGEGKDTAVPLIIMAAPAEWYHLILWDEMSNKVWDMLPKRIKDELKALGLARKNSKK